MNTLIRKCSPSDKEDMREICLKTSVWAQNEENKRYLAALYLDWYVDNEPDCCFVAEVDGNVVGYSLGCADYKAFCDGMKKNYLPVALSAKSFADRVSAHFVVGEYKKFVKSGYDCHLHVDVLDGFQRLGLGTKLIDALLTRLKQLGKSGVALCCSVKNEKGKAFYKKYGFERVGKTVGCDVFGIKFS